MGLSWSREKIKTLYLFYYNISCHKTWKSGDIPWTAPTHKVTRSLNYFVLWGHVTYEILYMSTYAGPKVVICRERRSTHYLKINSNGGLKQQHVESSSSTTKNIVYSLPQYLWPQNLRRWWLTMIKWSFRMTWQTKIITSPLPECILPPSLIG